MSRCHVVLTLTPNHAGAAWYPQWACCRYQAYADYHDMMSLTENLISEMAQEILGRQTVTYQGTEIDLSPPFRRASMSDLVREAMPDGFDFDALDSSDPASVELAREAAVRSSLVRVLLCTRVYTYSFTAAGGPPPSHDHLHPSTFAWLRGRNVRGFPTSTRRTLWVQF